MKACPHSLLVGSLFVVATLSGCTHGGLATAENHALPDWAPLESPVSPTAQYEIPAASPKGKASITLVGREQLTGPGGRPETFLHIRVTAENATDPVPWTLDPSDMKVSFDGSSAEYSGCATGIATDSSLAVAKGKHGAVDLYFPMGSEERPVYVYFLWQIHRGEETVTASTRLEMQDGPAPDGVQPQPAKPTGASSSGHPARVSSPCA
jgi:hypothetical protein